MSKRLTFDTLRDVVQGSNAAFRLNLQLEAVSPKVFPPTYEGGKYATENRRINGEEVPCVLLDSVASQANRMELALQEAWESGEIELPVVSVDFTAVNNPGIRRVTSLQAPHRIADAILRDSNFGNVKFRDTDIGKGLNDLSLAYATPLLTHAPHSLVFGMWDSTGPRGGLGVKFARAIVSEIVGVNAVPGVTTASRLDPLNIQKIIDKEGDEGVKIYAAKGGGWTLSKDLASTDRNGKPQVYGKKGKPSEINHGNVTPDLVYRKDKNGNLVLGDTERPSAVIVFTDQKHDGEKIVIRDERRPIAIGGFTIDYAEQTTVLSLPALRRLRFPTSPSEPGNPDSNLAARTYLAALGLLGATLAAEAGYDLRSRCILQAKNSVIWQLLGKPGSTPSDFILEKDDAIKLYKKSLEAVRAAKLPINTEQMVLTPSDGLIALVKKSMELTAAEVGGE